MTVRTNNTRNVFVAGAILLSVMATAAMAEESETINCENVSQQINTNQASSAGESSSQPASCVRNLLELQRSGAQASQYQQKLPALVLDDILTRYENSFTHPVPELFVSTEFSSSE